MLDSEAACGPARMEGADEGMTPRAYGSTPDSDSDSEDELEEVQQYFAQIDGTDADGFLRILGTALLLEAPGTSAYQSAWMVFQFFFHYRGADPDQLL